jgi:hypothetical protein
MLVTSIRNISKTHFDRGGVHEAGLVGVFLWEQPSSTSFNGWPRISLRSWGCIMSGTSLLDPTTFMKPIIHPVMDEKYIWVPEGEDYAGVCDRHMYLRHEEIFSARGLEMLHDMFHAVSPYYVHVPHI